MFLVKRGEQIAGQTWVCLNHWVT